MTGLTHNSRSSSTTLGRFVHRHWRIFLAVYCVATLALITLVIVTPLENLAECCHAILNLTRGRPARFREILVDQMHESGIAGAGPIIRVMIVVAFLATQLVVISGVGKVYIPKDRRLHKPSVVVSIGIVAFMLAALCVAIALTGLESTSAIDYVDEAGGGWSTRPWAVTMLFVSWAVWSVVAAIACLASGVNTTLSRMVSGLFVGSWLEFAAALAVDVGARDKDSSCECSYGSWVALMIMAPLLIWSFGPAVFLVYFRERRLAASDPSRAKRVLRRRSTHRE